VLSQSHHLLDDVAKERCGRDALAVQVFKPGGEHLSWSSPWDVALEQVGETRTLAVSNFARLLTGAGIDNWAQHFAYRVRNLVATLDHDSDGYASLPAAGDAQDGGLETASWLLAAELSDSSTSTLQHADLQQQLLVLLRQCQRHERRNTGKEITMHTHPGIREDAMLLARFLTTQITEA
jgi:CRISPR-associated protein Cmr2